MSVDVIAQWWVAVEVGDLPAARSCLAPGAVVRLPQLDKSWTSASIPSALLALRTAFPDFGWRPTRRYEADGCIVEEGVWVGTHRGVLGGVPATQRAVKVPARVTLKTAAEIITSVTVFTDLAALFLALDMPVSNVVAAQSAASYVEVNPSSSVSIVRADRVASPLDRTRAGRNLGFAGAAVLLAVVAAASLTLRGHPHRVGLRSDRIAAPVKASGSTRAVNSSPTAAAAPTPSTPAGAPPSVPRVVHNTVNFSTDVLFATGSATLTAAAENVINELAAMLRNDDLVGVIDVDGYTDDVGQPTYNEALSQARANAVVVALQADTVGPSVSVVGHGFGEADPIGDNTTAAGRQENRRVTIHLPAGGIG